MKTFTEAPSFCEFKRGLQTFVMIYSHLLFRFHFFGGGVFVTVPVQHGEGHGEWLKSEMDHLKGAVEHNEDKSKSPKLYLKENGENEDKHAENHVVHATCLIIHNTEVREAATASRQTERIRNRKENEKKSR